MSAQGSVKRRQHRFWDKTDKTDDRGAISRYARLCDVVIWKFGLVCGGRLILPVLAVIKYFWRAASGFWSGLSGLWQNPFHNLNILMGCSDCGADFIVWRQSIKNPLAARSNLRLEMQVNAVNNGLDTSSSPSRLSPKSDPRLA